MVLYMSHTDEALMELVKNGDINAFEALYDRYWEKMLVRANLLLRSQADAEDLVQDVFIHVWTKRDRIVLTHRFHTYVASVLKYKIYRRMAEKEVKPPSLRETSDHSTEQWLDYEYLRAELEEAVQALPEKCRIIFRLSREDGLTDLQIADNLGLAHKTVRTQMYRALKKLKVALHTFFYML